MEANDRNPKNKFQLELLSLMLSQEVKNYIDNDGDYANEPDDYVDELSALAFDPFVKEFGNLPLAN